MRPMTYNAKDLPRWVRFRPNFRPRVEIPSLSELVTGVLQTREQHRTVQRNNALLELLSKRKEPR